MPASTLDLALDDVIKKDGIKRGGGGKTEKRGNGGSSGGNRKFGQRQLKKTKSVPAADPPKPKDEDRKGMLSRLSFVKGMAAAAIATASKAAAAAAKATATGKTPTAHGKSEIAKVSKTAPLAAKVGVGGVRRRAAAGGKAGGTVESTAAKLSMTLEDICKVEVTGRRTKGADAKGSKGSKGAAASGGRLMRLKLNRDGNLKKKDAGGRDVRQTRAKGNAKAGAKFAERGAARGKASGKGDTGRSASSWYEPPSMQWGAKGGGKGAYKESYKESYKGYGKGSWGGDDWGSYGGGGGSSRRSESDDWRAPPAKRARAESWEPPARGGSWGRGGGDDYGSGMRSGGGGRWGPSDFHDHRGDDDRWDDRDEPRGYGQRGGGALAWDRPEPRASERFAAPRRGEAAEVRVRPAERTAGRSDAGGTRIKVTNVPLDLDRHDIKEAFEDRGRVLKCELDRGVAIVVFERASDAKTAVQTFDRGELNGQTIFVSLD